MFDYRLSLLILGGYGAVLLGLQPPVLAASSKDFASSQALRQTQLTPQKLFLAQATSSVESPNPNASVVQPYVKILAPSSGEALGNISSSVVVEGLGNAVIDLKVNGHSVDNELIGRTETNSQSGVTTTTWYGVIFQPGANTLTATLKVNGQTVTDTQTILAPGRPTQMRIRTRENSISADGRSVANVIGTFLDEQGIPAQWSTTVSLFSSQGEFVGVDQAPDQPGFQVKAVDGGFTAQLRADNNADNVTISAVVNDLEAFTTIQFTPALRRSPLITGFVDLRYGPGGNDYFGSFRDFLPTDGNNDYGFDVDSAVFATGSIGEWKYSAAYNSERPINGEDDRLFGGFQASEYQYPTYGTESTREATTPSIDQVYLRIERASHIPNAEPDFAMWGDYNLHEFNEESQEFTAVSRSLHGLKAHYNLGNLELTGFHSATVQGFQRDTIVPDGTSGYYFVSRRLVIPGSEEIYLETEELNRPGKVLQREQLRRGTDYEIDYDRGSILFNQPIYATDVDGFEVIVRRIVATYQYEDQGNDTQIYGGRVRYHFNRDPQSESWIGATYVKEDQDIYDFELYGVDSKISLGENTTLFAEYAHSKNFSVHQGAVEGSAYRVEVESQLNDWLSASAYYRQVDAGFTNNATLSFVPGQTRYGLSAEAQVSPTTRLHLKYDHEDNFGTAPRPLDEFETLLNSGSEPVPGVTVDNSYTTITAGIQQNIGNALVEVDWLHQNRTDRQQPSDLTSSSEVLRSRLTLPLTERMTLRAQNEMTLSSSEDSVQSDATIVGIDYQVLDWLTLNYSRTWFGSGPQAGKSLSNFGISTDHQLGEHTTVRADYRIFENSNGMSGQGTLGLQHQWAIAPGLMLDLGYEYTFSNFGRTGNGLQFRQPYAVGQSSSSLGFGSQSAYSIGLAYTDNPNFQAAARWEKRHSSQGSNTVITADAAGKLTPSLTALFSYNKASSAGQGLEGLGSTVNMKLGLAYRDPHSDTFNALLRYEYRKNPAVVPDSILFGNGTGSEESVFAVEAIYAPSWRWEFYGKYAFRHSTTYLADDFVADSTVHLGQLRASYRLGYQWDVAAEARWISQPSAGYTETGFMVETGYYLTPDLRLYGGYAFGSVSDYDFTGGREAGGAYAGINVKLNGLFGGWGTQQPVAPPQEQSSLVTAETP